MDAEDSPGRRSSIVSDQTSEGSVELFYASDVLGSPSGAQMTSLSRMLSSEPVAYEPFTPTETILQEETRCDTLENTTFLDQHDGEHQQTSVYANLFRRSNDQSEPDLDPGISWMLRNDDHAWYGEDYVHTRTEAQAQRERKKPSVTWSPSVVDPENATTHSVLQQQELEDAEYASLAIPNAKAMSRLDKLAQPRLDRFVEFEKRRLQQETESLRECTFKPNLSKELISHPSGVNSSPTTPTSKNDTMFSSRHATDVGAFPWLTLSPRQHGLEKNSQRRMSLDGQIRSRSQSVIERLHLDGTLRYDQRELAKEILEAERLRSCTFKPAINPTSRSLAFAVNYKPIHHRLSELQRARVTSIRQYHIAQLGLLTKLLNAYCRKSSSSEFESVCPWRKMVSCPLLLGLIQRAERLLNPQSMTWSRILPNQR